MESYIYQWLRVMLPLGTKGNIASGEIGGLMVKALAWNVGDPSLILSHSFFLAVVYISVDND